MKLHSKIVWAYLSEVVLSALLVGLAVVLLGLESVAQFAGRIGLIFVGLIGGVLFAAAFGVLLVLFQKSGSPFLKWLESKGALAAYETGFKYVAFICLLSFALVAFLGSYKSSQFLALATLYVLVLLGINAVTFLRNFTSLMRLESEYRKRVDSLSGR